MKKPNQRKESRIGASGIARWQHSFIGVCKRTGEKRRFFLLYFLSGGQRDWLGQHSKPMFGVVAGNLATLDYALRHCEQEVQQFTDALRITAGDLFLSEDFLKGRIVDGRHSYSWLLRVKRGRQFSLDGGAAGSWYATLRADASRRLWGPVVEYDGSIYLDGEEFGVTPTEALGYADEVIGGSETEVGTLVSFHCRGMTDDKGVWRTDASAAGMTARQRLPLIEEARHPSLFIQCGAGQPERIFAHGIDTPTRLQRREVENGAEWVMQSANRDGAVELALKTRQGQVCGIPEVQLIGGQQGYTIGSARLRLRLYDRRAGRLLLRQELTGTDAVFEVAGELRASEHTGGNGTI